MQSSQDRTAYIRKLQERLPSDLVSTLRDSYKVIAIDSNLSSADESLFWNAVAIAFLRGGMEALREIRTTI